METSRKWYTQMDMCSRGRCIYVDFKQTIIMMWLEITFYTMEELKETCTRPYGTRLA